MNDYISILDHLDDESIIWGFTLMNQMAFTGRIVTHKVTGDGVPVVLGVRNVEGNSCEIPWCNIQSITFLGKEN